MEQRKAIIGIDVSKKTLDIFIKALDVYLQISNNAEGFKKLMALLKANKLKPEDCFFVLEYTGGYEYRLVQFCQSRQISYVRISGLAIKRSMGLVRGKNDKIDARRIADYGDEKQSKLEAATASLDGIVRLKRLLSQRDVFVCDRKAHQNRYQEIQYMMDLPEKDPMLKRYKKILVPELNGGQLCWLLRAKYLAPAESLSKVQGRPFLVSELEAAITKMLG